VTSPGSVDGPVGRVDGLVARLTEQRGGKRSLLGALIRFGVTGVASVTADIGTLTALHSGFGVRLLWATLAAFGAGLLVNYSLNRNWTFQARADHRKTLVRYAVMVSVNFGGTLAIVLGLTHLGLYYLLSKLIAVAIIAVVNFTASRLWVFKH
jgi:putative flippase GtrA